MKKIRAISACRPAAALALVMGTVLSMQGLSQTAADDVQGKVVRRYNSYILGRIGEYLRDVERDRAIDPSDAALSPRTLALAHDAAGNTAAAFAEIERAYQLPGASPGTKFDLAVAGQLVALGAKDPARLKYWLTEMGKINAGSQPAFQRLIEGLGKPAESLANLQARLRNPATTEEQMGNIAPWLAFYGDAPGALEALRRERMATGLRGSTSLWLAGYRDVRELPGFRDLVRDIGLVDQWRRTGWSDFCRPVGTTGFECGAPRASDATGRKPADLTAASRTDWRQIGPHRTRLVEVEKDVSIEVVDWGGSGRPLVLLAGLGNTAHVFDTMAPKLTDQYHVYGITRRGYGISTAPETGYGPDRLGDDVLAVIRALNLDHPVVAGHSIAGQELSSIGSRFPDRVAGLIYLDAHYPYAFHDTKVEEMIAAVQAARAAGTAPAPPVPLTPPELIAEQIVNGKQQYTKVRVPLLAIMAGQQGSPNAADPAIVEAQKKVIRAAEPSSRIVYIPAANHYVFGSHEADVLAEMRAFMASLK